jgi:hypothetical protein
MAGARKLAGSLNQGVPKEQMYSQGESVTRIVKPLLPGTSKAEPAATARVSVVPSSTTSQVPEVISMTSGSPVPK